MSDALADLLPGERLYQQFEISIAWSQPIDGCLNPWQTRDLPPGRMWNGVHPRQMFRDNTTLEQAEQWAENYGRKYLRRKANELPDTADFKVRVAYSQSEVWSVGWFNHWTFDVGLSDADVLLSFERFVTRMEHLTWRKDGLTYCLMGAEDRYRWEGPCRCEHCKAAGVVRISH